MKYSKEVWEQLKNISADNLINALKKDNWISDSKSGAVLAYFNPTNHKRVTIHYHPRKTYGEKTLKLILGSIGWDEEDLKRLKIIK